MNPTVLLAMTTRWIPTVRLAIALKNAGFTVDALCLPGHPLQKTQAARETYPYNSLAPLRSFASAIAASKPDLILPGDDLATMQLHALYEREFNRGGKAAPICCVIERSLGSPSSFSKVYARTGLLEIAQEEDILVPEGFPGRSQIEWEFGRRGCEDRPYAGKGGTRIPNVAGSPALGARRETGSG